MTKNLTIEGAKLIFRNFAGVQKDYNPAGCRNFCVMINPDDVPVLLEQGWNVKQLRPKEDGDEPQPYLQVAVRFDNKPPKIVLVTSGGQTILDESAVASIDYADIENADVVITPYAWSRNGKSGIKAYLKTAYITIAEDDIEKKYSTLLGYAQDIVDGLK